jgi:glycosyltransferase involved in cell wall biosynthesis
MADFLGRRLRAAFVNDWWAPDNVGGAEESASECANYLALNGFDVTAFVPADANSTRWDGAALVRQVARPLARSTAHAGRRAHATEFASTWLDPRSAVRLVDSIAAFRPDVVVLNNVQRIHPTLFGKLRTALTETRIVRVVHDLSDTCWRRTRTRNGEPCLRTCAPCRAKRALSTVSQDAFVHGVVANSAYTAQALRAEGLLTGIPLIVGYPGLARASRMKAAIRPRGARTDRSPVFGFIGRVTREKGVVLALEAMPLIRETSPRAELIVAGPADMVIAGRLRARADQLSVPLTLTGHLSMTDFARMVDVALVPGLWPEPFGMVPMQLAALGVPTVVSGRGGVQEATALFPTTSIAVAQDLTPRDVARQAHALLVETRDQDRTVPTDVRPTAPDLCEALLHLIHGLLPHACSDRQSLPTRASGSANEARANPRRK